MSAVSCRADHARWSEPDVRDDHRLVLVRRGRFRRRADGASADLDPTLGYLGAPGEEERFAHPAGGDVCTCINLGSRLREGLTGGTTVYVDARVDMAHRRLLAAAAGGDIDYALTEELLHLITAAARRPAPARPGPADLGFADQAHLTRTVRAHLGRTPPALRDLLTGGSEPELTRCDVRCRM